MNLFFGKISKEFDQNQIKEGYYQASKGSTWFGELNIGDYVYLVGGDKIQFWQALTWEVHEGADRLRFTILNPDIGISLNDFIALKFLRLSKALFILTSRSSPIAFHRLELLRDLSPEQLSNSALYHDETNYRCINIVKQKEINPVSDNIQLYIDAGKLQLAPATFYATDVYSSFRDNLQYLGKGARNKDKALQLINDHVEGKIFSRHELRFRNFYDAFFCTYTGRKYFLVGAFWKGNDPEDMTSVFVSENRWENGYDDQFIKETNAIPKGSHIAIKSAYTRERSRSVMMIKARGVVVGNNKDGHNLQVEWENDFKPFEVDFGGYMTTVKEVVTDEHIDAIWGGNSDLELFQENNMNEHLIKLLHYKKQIILQGPPGTGKTRLAKEIAKILIDIKSEFNEKEISNDEIEKLLIEGESISSVFGNTDYNIKEVNKKDQHVVLRRASETEGRTAYSVIKDYYRRQLWTETSISSNDDRRAKAISKYLFDKREKKNSVKLKNSPQYKIIQFHPSYTYEDFIRGTVAESRGNQMEYKNVNKTLAFFAEAALKNFQDSNKIPELASKEIWLEQQYTKFKDFVALQLETSNGLIIKEGTAPKIIAIEESALRVNRYDNENDKVLIKDSDIVNGYIGLYFNNQPLKVKENATLSKSARSGMYYLYQNLIERFKKYLDENSLSFEPGNDIQKQELKNYVLIIDEINRANLASVLGELIYALEYRGESVDSIYAVEDSILPNKNHLILPPNLYIIGTMNTADRSVGHIDYAIRRRFAFVDILPEVLEEDDKIFFNTAGFAKVAALFNSINVSPDFEAKDVQIGHSYFIASKEEATDDAAKMEIFRFKMDYEIVPILNEYVKDGMLVGEIEGKDVKDYIKGLKSDVS